MQHCALLYSYIIAVNRKEVKGNDITTDILKAPQPTLVSSGCLHAYLINYTVND